MHLALFRLYFNSSGLIFLYKIPQNSYKIFQNKKRKRDDIEIRWLVNHVHLQFFVLCSNGQKMRQRKPITIQRGGVWPCLMERLGAHRDISFFVFIQFRVITFFDPFIFSRSIIEFFSEILFLNNNWSVKCNQL